MTRLLGLPDGFPGELPDPAQRARWCCAQLEEGNILFFANPPFEMPSEDIQFLLSQQQSGAGYHKNIAYRPAQDRLTGYAERDAARVAKLRAALRGYSQLAIRFTSKLLAPYAESWRVDFTSFRPQREEGRQLRVRARNDLIHFDSFPTRPSNGNRILRVFNNINPCEPRVWNTSETFDTLAERFARSAAFRCQETLLCRTGRSSNSPAASACAVSLALPMTGGCFASITSSKNTKNSNALRCARAGNSLPTRLGWSSPTWSAMPFSPASTPSSKRFIVSKDSLVVPEKAPVNILERLAGCKLTLN